MQLHSVAFLGEFKILGENILCFSSVFVLTLSANNDRLYAKSRRNGIIFVLCEHLAATPMKLHHCNNF